MFKDMKDLIMFIIACVISIGFGYMVYTNAITSGELIGLFSLVVGYYFGSSSKIKTNDNK